MDPILTKLRQRLERWELQHLRDHARHLSDQIDDLEDQLSQARSLAADAEDRAEFWHQQVLQLQEDLREDLAIGITKGGELGIASRPTTKQAAAKPVVKAAAKPVVKAAAQ